MTPVILSYQSTNLELPVPTNNGLNVCAKAVQQWSSQDSENKQLKVLLSVKGTISEKGVTWEERWDFSCSQDDLDCLESGFNLLKTHIEDEELRSVLKKPTEVFFDLHGWLRIGWVDESNKSKGYARFSHLGRTMTQEFEDFKALTQILKSLRRAANAS